MPAPPLNYPLTFRGFRFREKAPGSPSYTLSADHSESTREFYTPWSDDGLFAMELNKAFLGYSQLAGNGQGKFINRVIPLDHPNFPNYFFADQLRVVGDIPRGMDANNVGAFDEAMLAVRFSIPNYQVLTDANLISMVGSVDESSLLRFVEIEFHPSSKYQTVPALAALTFFPPVNQPVSTNQVVLLSEGDLIITWKQVPLNAIPWAQIEYCVGKTNLEDFGVHNPIIQSLISPTGIASNKLVFCVPRIKKPWKQANFTFANQNWATDLTYHFKYYPYGANHFYCWNPPGSVPPGYYRAKRTGGFLYPSADFKKLFRPPS